MTNERTPINHSKEAIDSFIGKIDRSERTHLRKQIRTIEETYPEQATDSQRFFEAVEIEGYPVGSGENLYAATGLLLLLTNPEAREKYLDDPMHYEVVDSAYGLVEYLEESPHKELYTSLGSKYLKTNDKDTYVNDLGRVFNLSFSYLERWHEAASEDI